MIRHIPALFTRDITYLTPVTVTPATRICLALIMILVYTIRSAMAPSNLAVLTKSHQIIARKKRAKKEQVKEVVFDDDARR